MLSKKELRRYDRQVMMFGKEAQEKLKKAKVAIVGLGGRKSNSLLAFVSNLRDYLAHRQGKYWFFLTFAR